MDVGQEGSGERHLQDRPPGNRCQITFVLFMFKVGLGVVIFYTLSPRLISNTRFPHSISVAVTLCGRAE